MNETIRKLKDVPYNLNQILEELRNNNEGNTLNIFKQTIDSSNLVNNNGLFEVIINHNMNSEIASTMVKTVNTRETVDFSCIEIDNNTVKIIISEAISIEVLLLGNSLVNSYTFNSQIYSDMYDKLDIEDSEVGLDFIMKLRPVQYRTNFRGTYIEYDKEGQPIEIENNGSRTGERKHQGLIAQEVKQVLDEMNIDFAVYQDHSINGDKNILSLSYEELVSPLIKSIQELNKKVIELENKLNS